MYSLAFSPDGRTLASANADHTIGLWDIADPGHPLAIGQPLATSRQLYSLSFGADGQILASASIDGTIELWNLDVSYAINRICATTTMTSQQWRLYIPEQPYIPPCQQ